MKKTKKQVNFVTQCKITFSTRNCSNTYYSIKKLAYFRLFKYRKKQLTVTIVLLKGFVIN